jgi:hypothetical protein
MGGLSQVHEPEHNFRPRDIWGGGEESDGQYEDSWREGILFCGCGVHIMCIGSYKYSMDGGNSGVINEMIAFAFLLVPRMSWKF